MQADRIEPASEAEIAEVVASARGKRRLRIEGNGTKSGWCGPTNDADRMATARLTGTVFYEPEELVLAVRPGTPVAEVTGMLRQSGQALAFDPPDFGPLWGAGTERGTIGGAVAANLAGPRRWKAGAARDHLLGLRMVNGLGEVHRAGSRVMKNVTGFDLPKLFAGSFGSLGVMTELTLKVLPRAETERSLALATSDLEEGCAALRAAVASPFEPSGAAFLPIEAARDAGLSGSTALLRMEGTELSIRWRIAALRRAVEPWARAEELDEAQSSLAWVRIRDASAFAGTDRALWRLSVAPSAGPAVLRTLAAQLPVDGMLDWVGGLVWVCLREPRADGGAAAVDAALAASGGFALLLRGPEGLRGPWARNSSSAIASLTGELRRAFDPDRVFAAPAHLAAS